MSVLKNVFFSSLSVTALVALTGCRGTVVVVAPGPHCANDPVEVCHDVVDYHGHIHHECHTEIHHHCWYAAESLGNPVGPVGLGRDFDVSFDSAQKLIDMAIAANKGDPSPALALGLSATDIANLAQQQLPTAEGLDAVAKNLDQDPGKIERLFTSILDETRQNKAALEAKKASK